MLNKLRLLTPGPTPLPEKVRLALAQDMIHHRKKSFEVIMDSVQKKLKILFGTNEPVISLAASGTGAMVAAVNCLFSPNEKVLVVEAGKFGQRWMEICQSRHLEMRIIKVEWGQSVTPFQIKNYLEENKDIKGVFIQLCETSTGVLQPIKEIAEVVSKTHALLIVDGISAVGISPCPMDSWKIDCLLTGSQKGLMLPPGLALISLSARAWQKAETIKPGCFYFNLIKEREILKKNQTQFTSPINLIIGLDASLDFILEDGLESIYTKQWALTQLVRTSCEKMNLKMVAKEHYSWGVTSVYLPQNLDGKEVLKELQENYGICLAGGQDQFKGKIVRIGHMGWVDWGDCVAALTALANVLHISTSFIESGLSAYNNALKTSYPPM